MWLLGLAAQIGGVVLQGAALDRDRVSIVQPLLVTTVIWAIPLGYFLAGQKILRREVLGAGIMVVGPAIFASLGDPAAGVDDAPASDWTAAIIVITTICTALLLFANRGRLTLKAAMYGTAAGVLYGLSATLMKPVAEHLHSDGWGVFGSWEVWVMAAAGLVGFLLQQISLSTGRLVTSVATLSVTNPGAAGQDAGLACRRRDRRAGVGSLRSGGDLRGRRRRRRGATGSNLRVPGQLEQVAAPALPRQ